MDGSLDRARRGQLWINKLHFDPPTSRSTTEVIPTRCPADRSLMNHVLLKIGKELTAVLPWACCPWVGAWVIAGGTFRAIAPAHKFRCRWFHGLSR